jgi:hypothetical protein
MARKKALLKKYTIIIGILSPILGVLAYFFPWSSSPDLKFFFNKNFNIVSTYNKVDSLSIFFRGRDVVKDSLNLSIERIKIINKGNGDIRMNDFGLDPFGIKILNCKIINVVVPKFGDDYLVNTLKPQIADSNHIYFQKTIFEHDKSVYIDVYLLCKFRAKSPHFSA